MGTATVESLDLSHLEFEERLCQAASGCDQAATWLGVTTCGCTTRRMCDGHQRRVRRKHDEMRDGGNTLECRHCHTSPSFVEWRPL